MSRTTIIIPFPGQAEREAKRQAQKDAAKARAQALPEVIQELDVAWIFEAAADRDSNLNK